MTEVINWTRDVEKRKEKKRKKKDISKNESTTLVTDFIRRGGQSMESIKQLRVLTKIKLLDEQEKGLGENG